MKVTTSIIWFVFTIIFLLLGIIHLQEVDNRIPPFTVPEFYVGQFSLKLNSGGKTVGLEEPVKVFVKDFNQYLETQNQANATANRRAAFGYFVAAFTALVSLVLVWWEDIQKLFRRKKSTDAG